MAASHPIVSQDGADSLRIRLRFQYGTFGRPPRQLFLIQPARNIAGSSVLIADQIAGKTCELKDPSLIAFYSTVREQLVDAANRSESGFWLDSYGWDESQIIRRLMDIGGFDPFSRSALSA